MERFFKGILIGLMFGVPIGAVGTMTVQRTLERGFGAGLLTGLGSSAADCLYACVGVFGLTFISDFLLKYQMIISIIGGMFVLIMGISQLVEKPDESAPQWSAEGVKMLLS
ncbi:MAG: LysE family translocator [Oscillospiraceae bacterium]|nr:LysE family translocator [Oscillospiraceae bacterium]